MTKKESIYNALGMIEGAVCVSQKNTRDVLMKAIDIIKTAIEEETKGEYCNHEWQISTHEFEPNSDGTRNLFVKRVCVHCGKTEFEKV